MGEIIKVEISKKIANELREYAAKGGYRKGNLSRAVEEILSSSFLKNKPKWEKLRGILKRKYQMSSVELQHRWGDLVEGSD